MRNRKMLFATFLLCLSALTAYGQSSPITVEIKPAQTAVKEGQDFSVSTVLRSTGTEVQVMRRDTCGYGDLWTSDNASIRIIPSDCKKPGFRGTTLKPGEVYQRDIEVRAKLAPGAGEGEWITFRLGFKSEFKSEKDPARLNPKPQTLWSNAITVKVTRASTSSQ